MEKKKRNGLIKSSFRSKLIISITALSILMVLIVAFVSIQIANRKIIEMAMLQSDSNTRSAAVSIENYYSKAEQWTTQILRIPELQEIASDPLPPDGARHNAFLMKMINTTTQAKENGMNFPITGLYLKNGDNYHLGNQMSFGFENYSDCVRFLNENGQDLSDGYTPGLLKVCNIQNRVSNDESRSLVFFRFLYERTTMKKIGILAVMIDNRSLCETFEYISKNCLIMDPDGLILSSSVPDRVGIPYDNSELIRLVSDSDKTNDTVSGESNGFFHQPDIVSYCSVFSNSAFLVAPFDYYSGIQKTEVFGYIKSILLVVLVSCLIAALSAFLLSSRLSSSIQKLTEFVKQTYTEKSGERYVPVGDDEIAYLGQKINDMLDHIERAANEREIDLKKQQIMELRLMQSQINPHLLYNTLDSVLWAIQNDNKENATELIASLSGFFRVALSRGVERIPLGKELELIENYINIQKLARGQSVTLIKELPEELLDFPVIKLTLQPLVENAYLHGFSGYRDDGTIIIRAKIENRLLTLSVEDNGIGMLPEEVTEINDRLRKNTIPEKSRSVGLYNVNRRIIHEYGKEYGVTLDSAVSEYTVVTVKIPYSTEKTEE